MIVWINGPFGIGKTHTAFELKRRLDGSVIFDPEKQGFSIHKRMEKSKRLDDFQDYPLWRKSVSNILGELDSEGRIIIVPMSVVNPHYFNEILEPLRNRHRIYDFILLASRENLIMRLIKRGDRNSWNMKQVDRCLKGLESDSFSNKIDTDDLGLYEVVDNIKNILNIEFKKNYKNSLFRKLYRLYVTVRHIRLF